MTRPGGDSTPPETTDPAGSEVTDSDDSETTASTTSKPPATESDTVDSANTADSTTTGPTGRELGEPLRLDDERTLRVTDTAAVRQLIVVGDDERTVRTSEDGQFLVVSLAGEGLSATPLREGLRLRAGGETYGPLDRRLPRTDGPRVAFELPVSLSPAGARIDWRDESGWAVPAETLERLATPPQFTAVEFWVDESVAAGEYATFDVQVTNRGGPGPFTALVRIAGTTRRVQFAVDGDTVGVRTESVVVDAPADSTAETVLEWGFGRISRTITVE